MIGNPPYVSAVTMARSEKEKKLFKKLFPEATGSYDLYVLFLLKALELSNSNYCWIIPNKFLIADYASKTKSKLLENGLEYSVDVSSFDVFKNVGVYPIIIKGRKKSTSAYREYLLNDYSDLLEKKFEELKKMKTSNTISSVGIKVCAGAAGFEAQKLKQYVRNNKVNNSIPFTVSGNIDRYSYNNRNVRYMKTRYENSYIVLDKEISKGRITMWKNPKIIIAGMTKCVEATYVKDPLAIGVGTYAIYDFAGYDPYFILGVLNSQYTTDYMLNVFKDKHLAGGYLAINKSTIEELPFPSIEKKQQIKISILTKEILERKKNDESTDDLEKQIDKLVYQIVEG